MSAASSQSGDLVLPLSADDVAAPVAALFEMVPGVIQELWLTAEAESCSLTRDEFVAILGTVGKKLNHGLPSSLNPDRAQRIAFYRGLHLPELALAQACALGRDAAWERFLKLYRDTLTKAAIAIAGSPTLGHELAGSLYADLYGFKVNDAGERRSPLASYTGRGSLIGWLRTTLAQRHIDHHRRTRRESPLDDLDVSASAQEASPASDDLNRLTAAVAQTLKRLPAEDRFLLASYFLDSQTLLQISRVLRIHEATVSRRLKRLAADLRKLLLHNLQSGGLSQRAAEEALGTDPRDLELSGEMSGERNLRRLLQTSQTASFLTKTDRDRADRANQT